MGAIVRPLVRSLVRGGGSGPTPPSVFGVWNGADKNTGIDIVPGSGDLIAELANLNNTWASLRATIGKSVGTGYFEANFPAGNDGLQFIGLAKSTATIAYARFIGYDNDGAGYFGQGVVYRNVTDIALPIPYTTQFIGVEVDFINSVARFYVSNTLAATISLATLAGPLFPAASLYLATRRVALNCGQTPFNRTPTAGIAPYWSPDA